MIDVFFQYDFLRNALIAGVLIGLLHQCSVCFSL